MDRLFTIDNFRVWIVSAMCSVLAFFTPTRGYCYALLIMSAFNIWCGMRADGVSVKNCKRFSFSKFKNALAELFLYVLINMTVFSVMTMTGDVSQALIVIKSLTYVFMYVYLQNSFKNLTIAYPKNKSCRIVYHLIRLEFKEAMPSRVQDAIKKAEEEIEVKNEKEDLA